MRAHSKVLSNTVKRVDVKIITVTISWETHIKINVGLECSSEHVPKLSEAPSSRPELQIKGVAGWSNHVENKVL